MFPSLQMGISSHIISPVPDRTTNTCLQLFHIHETFEKSCQITQAPIKTKNKHTLTHASNEPSERAMDGCCATLLLLLQSSSFRNMPSIDPPIIIIMVHSFVGWLDWVSPSSACKPFSTSTCTSFFFLIQADPTTRVSQAFPILQLIERFWDHYGRKHPKSYRRNAFTAGLLGLQ